MAGTTTKIARRFRGSLLGAALLSALLGAGSVQAERPVGAPVGPPPAPAPVRVAPAPAPAPEDEFDRQVRALEEQVHEAKEQVFRSRARLQLLGQKAAGTDVLSGAQAVIVHRNEMGSAFVLESITYRLDGATIFDRVDNGGNLARLEEFEIFRGRLMPGQHTVAVMATYRGSSGFGVFSYLEGYKFRSTSSYDFTVDGGKVTTVKVVGYEKGGVTAKLEERPAVRFDVTVARDTSSAGAEAAR